MTARVIGIGQAARGDDAVGLEIVRALRKRELDAGVEVVSGVDPADLVEFLDGAARVLLVDAVAAPERVGEVFRCSPEIFDASASSPVSSHGIGLLQAVELARAIHPDTVAPDIEVLAVCIDPPVEVSRGLSPPVAAAVPSAVNLAETWLEEA